MDCRWRRKIEVRFWLAFSTANESILFTLDGLAPSSEVEDSRSSFAMVEYKQMNADLIKVIDDLVDEPLHDEPPMTDSSPILLRQKEECYTS